ncbi:MAG: hypothetical protein VYC34_00235, partial [Planctomycetota bacterium]|nr:hypothetical protein [Planctomycetota bacterium]
MKRLTTALLLSTVAFAAAAPAEAGPRWNRKLEAVSVIPDPASAQTLGGSTNNLKQIGVALHARLNETISATLDLSTEVELFVNGQSRGRQIIQLIILANSGGGCSDNNCGGSCGNYVQDGFTDNMLCITESVGPNGADCACRTPSITANFPGIPTDSGDVIEVILRPAPGAAPEADTSDDASIRFFDGDNIFWNRSIKNARIEQEIIGGQERDVVKFDVDAFGNMNGQQANIAWLVQVVVNGNVEFSEFACQGLFIASPGGCEDCGNQCHVGGCNGGSVVLDCAPQEVFGLPTIACYCTSTTSYSYALPIDFIPFPQVRIILVPVPGALPELPGLEGDDSVDLGVDPCPADLDGDGVVG